MLNQVKWVLSVLSHTRAIQTPEREMIMSTDVWLPDCSEWIIKLNLGRDTADLEAVCVDYGGSLTGRTKMEDGCRASKHNKAPC